ncbi:hypothetical protein RPALISO_183 [Ruegeria phage RpAliso]|nr:hypothetical protein RPALISO_183 [Ruegeria phage RpAliso]
MTEKSARFIVNINGDTPDTLKKNHLKVVRAARALEEALREAAPNGRNYQFEGGPEEFEKDREEMHAMIRSAVDTQRWAENTAVRVYTQIEGE